MFEFDKVVHSNGSESTKRLFESCIKHDIDELFNGKSSINVILGATGSGRDSCMAGDSGLLMSTAKSLLSLIKLNKSQCN